jgi:enamine deaminase RidA (YjgF/YER057c/UK114 family)
MEMAGGTMDDVVRYVTYVTDRAYRFPMGKIFRSYFKMPPCGTGLIIDGLARPDMVVEIDCWAYIDDED